MKTLVKNAKIIVPDGLEDGSILIGEGKILQVGAVTGAADETIDACGAYVCPGFIDIHSHGAGGADFMDGTVEAYITAARMMARHGATLVFPTTLTSSDEVLFESFETYKKAQNINIEGAQFGGLHLEGPYFNPVQAGAQNPRFLHCPDNPDEYRGIIKRGKGLIKRWSFSPELEGAPAFASELRKNGILASIGHTNATFEECDASYRNGATHMTHFFSCMSTITRKGGFRTAGALEYGYYQKGMSIEIIADGCHVPQSLLKMILSVKGVDNITLVSDSMRGAGMPDGPSILGSLSEGQECIIEDGVAKMPDRSCFAGSVATADRLVRTMINIAGCSVEDAVRMATANPAKTMGIYDRKGSIEVGKDADLVIWNGDVNVIRTIVKGQTIYQC